MSVAWRPNPGPQTDFLSRTAHEVLYGGAAGGGKSDAILIDAIRYVGRGFGNRYHAILLRRTFPELEKSLIKRSHDLYPCLGGRYNEQKKTWKFPAREIVEFGHVEHEKSVHAYQGAAFQFIGFDELTSFTEYQYLYLALSRCRSAHGVPCRVRGGTNPGNEGHEWVFKRFAPWLDPEFGSPAKPGETLYFLRGSDEIEKVVPKGTDGAKSRSFIPARLEDNPPLAADGQYASALAQLDPVTREQLRNGNWLVKPGKGLYFQRGWFRFCDADEIPRNVSRARYWDLAATEAGPGKDPDWTVGVRGALSEDGILYVEDVARMRGNPGEVEQFVRSTSELDGKGVAIGMEQEPGASGKALIAAYLRKLNGFDFRGYTKRNDKVVAAGPVSAQVVGKNVCLVRAPWNEPFIQEGEQFPEGSHDDQIDAFSGLHTMLTGDMRPRRVTVGAIIAQPSFEDRELGPDF